MKRIAIDARYIGKSGIGRVLEGILDNLPYDKYEFYLVGPSVLKKLYPSAKVIEDDTNPFSKKGLLKINKIINKNCDCFFTPNFIIPFGIKIPIYSYIHDLLFLDMRKATTNGFIDYHIKKYLFKRCVRKSIKIFCVSKFTMSRCNYYFAKYSSKLVLNYNGISKSVIDYSKKHNNIKKENSIVFVGNVKSHKGINVLLDAFMSIKDNPYSLKIIGQKENFNTGINFDEEKYKNVIFTGKLTDDELYEAISKAKFLVQPSLYEGFGIPPLESLCLGTTPIVSNIEVFREVYQGLPVVFFNDSIELEHLLTTTIAEDKKLIEKVTSKYNYQNVVEIILNNIGV